MKTSLSSRVIATYDKVTGRSRKLEQVSRAQGAEILLKQQERWAAGDFTFHNIPGDSEERTEMISGGDFHTSSSYAELWQQPIQPALSATSDKHKPRVSKFKEHIDDMNTRVDEGVAF